MITMDEVKKELKRKGITQKEFSEIMGVSLTAIQKWFNGTSQPTMKRYIQILNVLSLDSSEPLISTIGSQNTTFGSVYTNTGNGNVVQGDNSAINTSDTSVNNSVKANSKFLIKVPIIDRANIKEFNGSYITEIYDYISFGRDISNKCFGFMYYGIDMKHDAGSFLPVEYAKYSISDGSLVVVDTTYKNISKLKNGRLVVCNSQNGVNIRIVYIDGLGISLLPLNSHAQQRDRFTSLDQNEIIGTVVKIRLDFDYENDYE